jgi:hypothetical protein
MAKNMGRIGKTDFDKQEEIINKKISEALESLKKLRGREIFPLFLTRAEIRDHTVDHIFDELRKIYPGSTHKNAGLDVLLESGGGSIDSAYNIALLLRRYAIDELNIIIPRWAKSAATVIACAGDKIEMTPVAELGPVDPQITMLNPLEKRLEEFSPLDIGSTLQLIRDEFSQGHTQLAQGLLERLQFPLTLGGIKKSLDVGVRYIERLLSSRMFKDDIAASKKIAEALVQNYSTHAFCIDCDEAKTIGLKVMMLPDDQINCVWEIRKLILQRDFIDRKREEEIIGESLKGLPPELLRQLRDSERQKQNNEERS